MARDQKTAKGLWYYTLIDFDPDPVWPRGPLVLGPCGHRLHQ